MEGKGTAFSLNFQLDGSGRWQEQRDMANSVDFPRNIGLRLSLDSLELFAECMRDESY